MAQEILLASSNLHKIYEFKEMFRLLPHIELISIPRESGYIPPEETGQTFKENALLKAEHAAQFFKGWVLADDSGLVVPALQGAPGVRSRRYAGEQATDHENRQKLLLAMEGLDGDQRFAYYECSLAIANENGVQKSVQGICEGVIAKESKGGGGFGYDPLFFKHDYEKTFAELHSDVKNRISHRRKAFDRLLTFLETIAQKK